MSTERYAPPGARDTLPDDDEPATVDGRAPARVSLAPQATELFGVPLSSLPSAPAALATAPASSSGAVTAPARPSMVVPPLGPGRMLKHFRVDAPLAEGGMGAVWLGFDTALRRAVAIKTIRPELAKDPVFLERFTREAVAQANVIHEHVVQVSYVGEDHGTWFLAMQLVDGGSLYARVDSDKPPQPLLSWQEAHRLMTGTALGLAAAADIGIVHRDVKPANILLDKLGRPLLSDFGLATVGRESTNEPNDPTGVKKGDTPATATTTTTGSQLQLAQVTQVGIVMGTPEYVAPEQIQAVPGGGVVALDSRADVYALGASFFHLLTGAPACPAATLPEAIAFYRTGKRAPRLQSVRKDVPRAFADVVDSALRVDPSTRPTTKMLVEMLRRAAPQPEVPASAVARALAFLFELVPFVVLTLLAYERQPYLAPIAFVVAILAGTAVLRMSPGLWVLRLRLRTPGDGDVSIGRAAWRSFLGLGFYPPLSLGFSAVYGATRLEFLFYVGAAWLLVVLLGALPALLSRPTLLDRLTGTRVLVDVRIRG